MLVNTLTLIDIAKKKNQPILAFNILSLEMIQGVLKGAVKMKQNVILQTTPSALKYANFNLIVPALISAAKKVKILVAIHLDHCQDLTIIKQAISAGYTSIMYDGSHYDLKQNIENSLLVKKIIPPGVSLELEIGKVGGKEDEALINQTSKLSFAEVETFYNSTKPDLLAVGFGTRHGIYHQKVDLNWKLLANCQQKLPVPLVMHGSSGLNETNIKKAISLGIKKINIGTDLLIAYYQAISKYLLNHPQAYDMRKINNAGIEAISKVVEHYFKITIPNQSFSMS